VELDNKLVWLRTTKQLMNLLDKDLHKTISITSFADCTRIMEAINYLKLMQCHFQFVDKKKKLSVIKIIGKTTFSCPDFFNDKTLTLKLNTITTIEMIHRQDLDSTTKTLMCLFSGILADVQSPLLLLA